MHAVERIEKNIRHMRACRMQTQDVTTTQNAVRNCRRMHVRIAHACETIPQNFTAPELQYHAAKYRALIVRARMSTYIHAFVIRKDPIATSIQRARADVEIEILVTYCRSH